MIKRRNIKNNKVKKDNLEHILNIDTKIAIEEGDILVSDKNTKRYHSVEELRKDLDV